MPKSVSAIQSQIDTCEENIKRSVDVLVFMAEGQDIKYEVDLESFIANIPSLDIKQASSHIRKAIRLFNEVEKIFSLENKRRKYVEEMEEALDEKEKNEDMKKMVRSIGLKRKAQFNIQAPGTIASIKDVKLEEEVKEVEQKFD